MKRYLTTRLSYAKKVKQLICTFRSTVSRLKAHTLQATMAFQPTPSDVSVLITTPTTSANSEPHFVTERRITPTWTVMQLKSKLETMTGIPPSSQRLKLKTPGCPDQWVDGDENLIGNWGVRKGCEIEVRCSR